MNPPLRRFLTIVLGSTGLACALGIAVDLVTAHVAVEWFSVHHPRIVPTANPWALALAWGVAASWWFGALSGVVVATVNHRRRSPLEPGRILRWVRSACAAVWAAMMAILLVVLFAANTLVPVEKRGPTFHHDARLVAVALAHQSEYVLGAIALLAIGVMTWRARPPEGPAHAPREEPASPSATGRSPGENDRCADD